MYWRKMKLNIIICLVVLAVLAYILIPIIIAQTASDDESKVKEEAKKI